MIWQRSGSLSMETNQHMGRRRMRLDFLKTGTAPFPFYIYGTVAKTAQIQHPHVVNSNHRCHKGSPPAHLHHEEANKYRSRYWILRSFWICGVEGVLTSSHMVWYERRTVAGKKVLQRGVKSAQRTTN